MRNLYNVKNIESLLTDNLREFQNITNIESFSHCLLTDNMSDLQNIKSIDKFLSMFIK